MAESDGAGRRHPYHQPGVGVPDNLAGIVDFAELDRRVKERMAAVAAEVRQQPLPDRFDRHYLQRLHGGLDDIFGWAGQLRVADLGDPHHPGEQLVAHQRVPAYLNGLLGHQLAREGELRDLRDPKQWADRAAYYLAGLEKGAPFYWDSRETIKVFGAQLARAAGHTLDWSRVAPDEHRSVVRHAHLTGYDHQPFRESLLRGLGASSTPYTPPPTDERLAPESRLGNVLTDIRHALGGLRSTPKAPDPERLLAAQPPVTTAHGKLNHVDYVLGKELAELTAGGASSHSGYLERALAELPGRPAATVRTDPRGHTAQRPERTTGGRDSRPHELG